MAEHEQKMAVRDGQAYDVQDFATIIRALGDGDANKDIMANFLRVIESTKAHAVRTSNAKGSKGVLSIKIPVIVTESGVVTLYYDVSITEPKLPKKSSVLWSRENGKLSLRDPKQMELFSTLDGGRAAKDPTEAPKPAVEVQ